MAIPTFNGTALFSAGARDMPEAPQPRYVAEALPGVNGLFAQLHGCGGRRTVATGLLSSTVQGGSQVDAASAHRALKEAIRERQDLGGGSTLADYVGTDGRTYSPCLLLSYEAVDRPRIIRTDSGAYNAVVSARAVLLELDP